MTTTIPKLHVSVVALFPEIVTHTAELSVLGRATRAGAICVEPIQIRDYATDKHRKVDDTPSGGGPGLVMRVDVVVAALRAAIARDEARFGEARRHRVALLDAGGTRFTQHEARRLAAFDHLILVCGRYEGIDARIRQYVDDILTLGDFVLTGGELAAAVVLDATAREIEGVLGNEASTAEESHQGPRLEYRQYTRPNEFEGLRVPRVLLSGDHQKIAAARRRDGLHLTAKMRPDLVARSPLSLAEEAIAADDDIPLLTPERLASNAHTGPDRPKEDG